MDRIHVKNSTGYLKEKAIITLSRFTGDDVNKSILKSTSHMLKVPKERYVQRLVAASYGRAEVNVKDGRPISEYIVDSLEKRLHSHNWVIVLKTLVVLHRLISDSSEEMVKYIIRRSFVFDMSKVKYLGNSYDAINQSKVILQYIHYLRDRVELQRFIGAHIKLDSAEYDTFIAALDPVALMPQYDALLSLLEFPLYVTFCAETVNNSCTMEAYELIVHEGKRLFSLVSDRMVFILDQFDDLSLIQKRDWLDVLKRYSACVQHLKHFFDTMTASKLIFVEKIPSLKPLASEIIEDMELRVECSASPKEVCTLESLGIESVPHSQGSGADGRHALGLVTRPTAIHTIKNTYTDATNELPKPKFDMNSLFDM